MTGTRLSVLLSTYNRCDGLRETLDALCELDSGGLSVEFVVVDNNSSDDTGKVIDSFSDRLPLRHLFESRPGKNCALNHALDTVDLGEIVVFTDDDVVPRRDWLTQIVQACQRWPEYAVFGGKITPIWPGDMDVPRWARDNANIRAVGFGEQDVAPQDVPYKTGKHPAGANFWARRSVFEDDLRYDESIGPRPGQRWGMGSEAELLLRVASEGHPPLYVPEAVVGHHAHTNLLEPWSMQKRFIRLGRGEPHLHGIPDPDELARHPWRWRGRRLAAMAWHLARYCGTQVHRDEYVRMDKATRALRLFAYHRESLFMGLGDHKGQADVDGRCGPSGNTERAAADGKTGYKARESE